MKEISRIKSRFFPNGLRWDILTSLWGGLICGLLVKQYGYAWWMIPAHICMLIGCGRLLLGIRSSWPTVGRWISSFWLIGLGIIYSYAIISNHLWGRFISWQMIGITWGEGAMLREAVGLCASWTQWIIGAILLMTSILIYVAQHDRIIQTDSFFYLKKGLFIVILLGLGLLGYQGGEPISNTLRPRVYPPFPQTAATFRSAIEDARSRLADEKQEQKNAKHIILIMVDALRADHLGIYGYERMNTPFLQTLKESGRLQQVDWAFASCSNSTCGIASTLNSRSIDQQGMSHYALHHLLHQQGYDVNFFLSGEHRPFYYLDKAHESSIDRFQDGISAGRTDPYHDDLVLEELDALIAHGGDSMLTHPQFFYLHLMSAHSNRVMDSAYAIYQPTQSMHDWGHAEHLDYDHAAITNTYDNGVLQVDAYIAAIWDRLQHLKLLDNAIVVITGDHGEGLGEHGYYGHRYHLFPEGVRIPLLIYDSDSTRYQNLFFARQMDIAATLVDRIGLQIPEHWEGRSLLDPLPKQSEAWVRTVERPGWYGKVSQQDSTLIYCVSDEKSGEAYWFDLREQIEEKIDSCAVD